MTALPSMQTPHHPDEERHDAPDLTEADMLWCIRQLEPDWCLYYETIDGAFNDLWKLNPDKMDALIREIDEDNAELARLDCSDLGEWLEAIAMTPALMRRQAN